VSIIESYSNFWTNKFAVIEDHNLMLGFGGIGEKKSSCCRRSISNPHGKMFSVVCWHTLAGERFRFERNN